MTELDAVEARRRRARAYYRNSERIKIHKSFTYTGIAINSIFKGEHVTQRILKIYARMSNALSNIFFEQMVLNTSNIWET